MIFFKELTFPLAFKSKRKPPVFDETQTVVKPVASIILLTLSSSKNCASAEMGTIVTESEMQAN